MTGSTSITTGTATKHDHIKERIEGHDAGGDDYSQNIQIAELNALNAALAVIKWKKLIGFYHDLGKEHNTVYEINTNKIITDDTGKISNCFERLRNWAHAPAAQSNRTNYHTYAANLRATGSEWVVRGFTEEKSGCPET